jgi:hypothetical protein
VLKTAVGRTAAHFVSLTKCSVQTKGHFKSVSGGFDSCFSRNRFNLSSPVVDFLICLSINFALDLKQATLTLGSNRLSASPSPSSEQERYIDYSLVSRFPGSNDADYTGKKSTKSNPLSRHRGSDRVDFHFCWLVVSPGVLSVDPLPNPVLAAP